MSSTKTSQTLKQHSNAGSTIQLSALNAGVSFGSDIALQNVSFSVRQGEFIGIVGQNGSGKTTLLRLLLGLERATAGKAELGRNTVIGYVPQRGQLYDGIIPISAEEVVMLGAKGDRVGAQKAIKEVGMSGFSRRSFNELSGGQQQRIVIAKALASGADLLILDEPTTGVDEGSQKEFYALLEQIHRQNRTIIMVSHDIDSIVKIVSRVISLNRTIIYDGIPAEFKPDQHLRSDFDIHLHSGAGHV